MLQKYEIWDNTKKSMSNSDADQVSTILLQISRGVLLHLSHQA